MLKPARSYQEACRTFRWRIPDRYNLAFDICDRQTMAGADGHRTALLVEAEDGTVERLSFHMLRLLSNRLANVLAAGGIGAGDRVAISFPPSVEAAVALVAVVKMGAVAVPIPTALGQVPLAWRLANSGAAAALVSDAALAGLEAARTGAPDLALVLAGESLWAAMERASDSFAPALTAIDDPAFLFYPQDAMGKPAAALHGHRLLPGNLPPAEFALDFFPQAGDVFWTPADWMCFETLAWALCPAWHHGVTVVASPVADLDRQLPLIGRHGVRTAWIPSSMMARAAESKVPRPPLRALATGPEPLDEALRTKAAASFGTPANEIWGSVVSGAVAANCQAVMEAHPGSPGQATPGVTVEAVDEAGRPLPAEQDGLLAANPGAPGACLGRWTGAGWTPVALESGWIPVGPLGRRDLDGYLWPAAETFEPAVVEIDGLAVAVAEVEQALIWHPAVAAAAVLDMGGELKAFIVLTPGTQPDIDLARSLQAFVAERRARHEAPRRVEFVTRLPVTETGAIDRAALLNRPLRLDAPDPVTRWK